MRIVVKIPRSHRELLQELETVPSRERAERMRMLASIGLVVSKQGEASVDRIAPPGESTSGRGERLEEEAGGKGQDKSKVRSRLSFLKD